MAITVTAEATGFPTLTLGDGPDERDGDLGIYHVDRAALDILPDLAERLASAGFTFLDAQPAKGARADDRSRDTLRYTRQIAYDTLTEEARREEANDAKQEQGAAQVGREPSRPRGAGQERTK